MMNATLNRQWRQIVRDMSSPEVAEAMTCLDQAGRPDCQHPMSTASAVRVLLWRIQALPHREAPDKRLRALASQRVACMTSALARVELPADSTSSVDSDLRCANQALRELHGNSAEPIVLRHFVHRDRRSTGDPSSEDPSPSAAAQGSGAYRILHDLTIIYVLYAAIILTAGFAVTMLVHWIAGPPAPFTVAGFAQTWARIAGFLGDLTPLTLPMMTLVIGLFSIPILTGDGRSASLEDRGRQLFLNRAIHIASFTVATLSILSMPHSSSTEVGVSIYGVISSVMIILFALLPPTLTNIVVDERRRNLHKTEKTIGRIDALLSEDQSTSSEPVHRSFLEKLEHLFHQALSVGFLVIFAAVTVVILCFAFVCTHAIRHSVKLTMALPLISLGIMLFFLAYSTRNLARARWFTKMYDDKPPRWAVMFLPAVSSSVLSSFTLCLPIALTGHAHWFLISFITLTILQTVFAAAFQHLFPTKEAERRRRFLMDQRTLNEQTVETERRRLGDRAA